MCGIAMSRLHISSLDFWNTTPIELDYAFGDHIQMYKVDMESRIQITYDSMRLQTLHIYAQNPNIKASNKPKAPEDVMRFAWDEKPADGKQTAQERRNNTYQIAKQFGATKRTSKTKKKRKLIKR